MVSRHLCGVLNLLLFFGLLAGCGGVSEPVYSGPTYYRAERVNLADSRRVQALLYAQLREWEGVRYREGGLSKRGVDCSGFVYITYRSRFGIGLPRSTAGQSRIGNAVRRWALRPGDLVFFNTGAYKTHVGIYLGNGRFAHASTSRGVMASSLENPYWSNSFWKAVRVGS